MSTHLSQSVKEKVTSPGRFRLLPHANSVVYVLAWTGFTAALAVWWYIFTTQSLRATAVGGAPSAEELEQQLTMLGWEGGALVFLILSGGLAIAHFMVKEQRERRQLREFLLTFTHELKTPIASLRLQSESLADDLGPSSEHAPLVSRILGDAGRLTVKLENSLLLAQLDSYVPFMELVSLSEILEYVKQSWPGLRLSTVPNIQVVSDRRALETIVSNIFANAMQHGDSEPGHELSSKLVEISVNDTTRGKVTVTFSSALRNQSAVLDQHKLGALFYRPHQSSGNGVGLYLIRNLTAKIGGEAKFVVTAGKFEVQLTF